MDRPLRLALVLALTGSLAACSGGSAPSSASATVTVEAAEFTFTPDTIEVSAGAPVTITLTNAGTIEHDITVDAVDLVVHVKVGETASGVATFSAGTYEFYCSIPGHKQAGMVGTLTAT